MIRRHAIAVSAMFCVAAILAPTLMPRHPLLVWNATASVARGLYRVTSVQGPRIGDLVVALPPSPLDNLLAARGYLPAGIPLIKRVGAVFGNVVCRQGRTITVDSSKVAEALAEDRSGRPLPSWDGCHEIGPDEVFFLVPGVQASLDGRYFGVSAMSSIIGKAVPLWTW